MHGPMACHTACSSLTVMLLALGEVFPIQIVQSYAYSSVTVLEKGIDLVSMMGI